MAEQQVEQRDDAEMARSAEDEIRGLIGLFDSPAFVRRGQEIESGLSRLDQRCARARAEMLEMVRLRLKQWAAVAAGPDDWADTFDRPIEGLWALAAAPAPVWAPAPGTRGRRRAVARDLVASIERFNRRWGAFVERLNLDPINQRIDQYNRYYVLEKECVLGSQRLAARGFEPMGGLTAAALLEKHPLLAAPRPAR
jgi:hypothetical protein